MNLNDKEVEELIGVIENIASTSRASVPALKTREFNNLKALLKKTLGNSLRYKALITHSAPVASKTSGTFNVGEIWEILDYVSGVASTYNTLVGGTGYTTANGVATTGGTGTGLTVDIVDTAGVITGLTIAAGGTGYSVGDVITVDTGGEDATFTLTAVLTDDFSNMELISGTMNTTGAFIRATSTTPTVWTAGSDLAYDGRPYIVSTDVNNKLNALMNTLGGEIDWSYSSTGVFIGTLVGAFKEFKTTIRFNNAVVDARTYIYRISDDEIEIDTLTFAGAAANNRLTNVLVDIEVFS